MVVIDADFPGYVFQQLYQDPQNVFICTTTYDASLVTNRTFAKEFVNHQNQTIQCSNRVPCTLPGLVQANDYDTKGQVCSTTYAGCDLYQCWKNDTNEPYDYPQMNPAFNRTPGAPLSGNDPWIPPTDTCDNGQLETICLGATTITYFTCPLVGTVIGAAFGYLFLVELAGVIVVVGLYLLISGRRYSLQDLGTAVVSPNMTLEQARAKRLTQQSQTQAETNGQTLDLDLGTDVDLEQETSADAN